MSRIARTEPGPVFSKVVEYHGFIFTSGIVARDGAAGIRGQPRDVLVPALDSLAPGWAGAGQSMRSSGARDSRTSGRNYAGEHEVRV